jgi:hypothetical protein
MKSLAGWQIERCTVGALVALFAVVFAAPSPVLADCGDYVVRATAAPEKHAQADVHTMRVGANPAADYSPLPVKQPPGPCRGPHCSQRTPAPLAPAPSVSVRAQEWGCVLGWQGAPDLELTAGLLESETGQPARLPTSIYHPPRRSTR